MKMISLTNCIRIQDRTLAITGSTARLLGASNDLPVQQTVDGRTITQRIVAHCIYIGLMVMILLVGWSSEVTAHRSSGYSHDSNTGETNAEWMAALPDGVRLSDLSIPGTHDTGAYNFGGDSVETQAMDIATQLNAGIRAFDIRLGDDGVGGPVGCPDGTLWIFHGFVCQDLEFGSEILPVIESFLNAHPDETVVMRIRHEFGSRDNFNEVLAVNLASFDSILYTVAEGGSNPILGDLRGKILVLRDNGEPPMEYGIDWGSLNRQDNFNLSSNFQMANKWRDVRDHFVLTDSSTNQTIFANFLSAAGGGFPYFFASGHSSPGTSAPRLATGLTRGVIDTCATTSNCIDEFPSVNCFLGTCTVAFEGINNIARDYLSNSNVVNRTGIVFADFPGAGLIREIININELNEPPVAEAGGPYQANEGQTVRLIGEDSFDPNGDPLMYQWDTDGNGTFDTTFNASFSVLIPTIDNGVFNVALQVTDGVFTATDTSTVTISNVPPTVTVESLTTNENDLATLSGTITDPGVIDSFFIQVSFGDGSDMVTLSRPAGTTRFSTNHRYLDDDPTGTPSDTYVVDVTVTDDDGGVGTDSRIVTVNNVEPVVTINEVRDGTGALIENENVVFIHDPIDIAASFTDVGSLDTHNASINWGDGSIESLGPTFGTVSTSHTYADAFQRLIELTVTDDDLGTGTSTRQVTVITPEGALLSARNVLNTAARDAARPVLRRLEKAVKRVSLALQRLNGPGASRNSTLPAVLTHVRVTVDLIELAEGAGGPDFEEIKIFLGQTAQSVAREAVSNAEASRQSATSIAQATSLIGNGTSLLSTGTYKGAIDAFRAAVLRLLAP